MGFPTVRVSRDTEVYNPFTGAREKLTAGQELKDTDRILSYLLAEGSPDEYGERGERGAAYLPGLMEVLEGWTQADLAAALLAEAGTFQLTPSTSGQGESAGYLASLITAWAGGGGGDPVFFEAPEIEILNGCGVVGAGTGLKAQLESRGFKVAEAGKNAKVMEGGRSTTTSPTRSAWYATLRATPWPRPTPGTWPCSSRYPGWNAPRTREASPSSSAATWPRPRRRSERVGLSERRRDNLDADRPRGGRSRRT